MVRCALPCCVKILQNAIIGYDNCEQRQSWISCLSWWQKRTSYNHKHTEKDWWIMDKEKQKELNGMLKELQEILANSEHELTADNLRRLSTLAGEAKGELFSSFVKAFRKSVLPRTNAERLTGSAGVMAQTAILPLATEDRAALMVLKDADL